MADSFDIAVIGAGPVGTIAALALAQNGLRVALVGPAPAPDRRTTALMAPTLGFLDGLGLRGEIERHGAPLRSMRICDGTKRLVRAPTVTFHASEINEPYFGINIPNARLNEVLAKGVDASDAIGRLPHMATSVAPDETGVSIAIDGGPDISARLAVAADGRGSRAREAAGIAVRQRALPQVALVVDVAHARPHGGVSTEFHTESGPFTQVPLAGDRSGIVWVLSPREAQRLAAATDAELSEAIEQRMDSLLGAVQLDGKPQTFALSTSSPSLYGRNRVALVGEAAHVFPPIGAQGMNLGVRDVEALASIARRHADDPGSAAALSAYHRARRPDVAARSAAVNLLNASLLSDLLPAQLARSAGLATLVSAAPLRAFFMREGLRPGSGWQAIGDDLSRLNPFAGKGLWSGRGDRAQTPRS